MRNKRYDPIEEAPYTMGEWTILVIGPLVVLGLFLAFVAKVKGMW